MKNRAITSAKPELSLRIKLLSSYLAVALGAILLLAVVISLAIQYSFANAQQYQVSTTAQYVAQQIGLLYRANGANWDNVPPFRMSEPALLVVVDNQGTQRIFSTFPRVSDDELPKVNAALKQALEGQEVDGQLQSSYGDDGFTGYYACVPLHYNGQPDGQIIGAMFFAQPDRFPGGLASSYQYHFLANVNQAILIAGIIITLAVIVFSLFLARSLTRPLERLTRAAEQMGNGDYTQRVAPPKGKDELERLATSFNSMAERIESDVTELRHQEELRRDLIANMAHDLATPLTAIQGFSEALADEVITEPRARQETAQLIGREVQRLRRLVSEIQQMASLESGRATLEFAPLNMQSLVDETLAVIRPECEQADITVTNDIASDTPPVLADSDRITQVLLNLLDNARRHTPAGGSITVGARQEGTLLEIEVRDTGSGISPEDQPYIFERFYRADRSRSGATGGSGLGLSIVKAIIIAHGGTIRAESVPGAGTRILFTLPLVQDAVPAKVS